MRSTLWIIMISFCLTGCSEMRIIGNAAMRELQADAVVVNWNKTVTTGAKDVVEPEPVKSAKVKSFSSYRKNHLAKTMPTKGLWERKGSTMAANIL